MPWHTKHKKHSLYKQKRHVSLDLVFLVMTLILVAFGFLMVYEASAASAFRDFGDRFHYIKDQARWVMLGLAGMGLMAFFPYKHLYNIALPFLLTTIVALCIVFIPGIGVKAYGAHRWVNLGFFTFQPSEIAKLALIIYLSAWFSHPEKGRLKSFIYLIGSVLALIIAQPDLGTAVLILAVGIVLYYISGSPLQHLLFLLPIGLLLIIILSIIAPYRMSRITTFLHPDIVNSENANQSTYHIRQVIIGLGSGGLLGVGLGESLQKYGYIPEATTDSIFSIIGEELGFIGALTLLIFFLIFLLRGYRIALNVRDTFGRNLGIGIMTLIGVQIAVNLSAMVALLPLTGIPLPFISYGGTNLIILMTCVGIMINLSRHQEKNIIHT